MLKLLRTFQVVYETLNFSHAAEILFLSQPAVSNQIKQLERELEVTLFSRKGRQEIRATKQARILYERSQQLLEDWEETVQEVTLEGQGEEICRISASHTFAVQYLPHLMTHLIEHFPHVYFRLTMQNSDQTLEAVKKHEVDFGFIEKPLETPGIERTALMEDELVLAGAPSSDLWLIRENTSGVYHYTKRYFEEQNVQGRKMEVASNDVITAFLKAGIGRSVISKQAVPSGVEYETLNVTRYFYLIQRSHLTSDTLLAIAKEITSYHEKCKRY